MILEYFSPRVNDICHYLGGRGITYKFWPDVIRAGLIKRYGPGAVRVSYQKGCNSQREGVFEW